MATCGSLLGSTKADNTQSLRMSPSTTYGITCGV
ncbi:Uncharacterised protein [Vibrio cholerae]|nr:Uncharacterised protein [Vibrio cholerae]CSH82102.1 Uncharacterised protein [Vibrio cholerae]